MFDTPGVYVREIPSGARPIAGVSTSNTTFIGIFERGPVNEATRVTSYGEFARIFGGLFAPSQASYAIQHYFLNGGSVAFIVRVTAGTPAAAAVTLQASTSDDVVDIEAASEGAWGNNLAVGVALAAGATDTFTMLVREYDNGRVVNEEAFIDLSTDANAPRYGETVVNRDSELITFAQTADLLPVANTINAVAAQTLEDLLEAALADLTALDGATGADGAVPGAAGWEAAASSALRGSEAAGTGIYALNAIVPEQFNLMCIPDAVSMDVSNTTNRTNMVAIYQEANTFCRNNFAFLLIDIPENIDRADIMPGWISQLGAARGPNAAAYFPRLAGPDGLDPLNPRSLPSSGAVAGLFARTDSTRGVWKAPAGTDARIAGGAPEEMLTDRQQGPLNTAGLNVLRTFPVHGSIVWGARTLDGADARASEWRYVPVRRLALFIEASLRRGLQWAVFEPNDEPLWGQIRLNVGSFMNQLHRQGAFAGASARDAYLVKCDSETTTQADINLGIVNVLVAFAPVRPAEFVILRIQQRTQTSA
jgi:phage tail sheath protein FI